MILFEEIRIKTPKREALIDITSDINKILKNSNITEGVCHVFVPHTTAGITINENADPSVKSDISNFLGKLIPQGGGLGYTYRHGEGNSDAHIKCTLTGNSIEVLIHEKRLVLGTWQGIILTEYDGPRNRRIIVQIQGEI
ncbi:MAG: secondary thiamine-phosphate synthase enzyme YjbQ [Promethearchaeota archaeon]|jgi:secondary thiamine-phosphate synthase enzyme